MRGPRILARLLGVPSVRIDGAEVLQSLPAKSRELLCYLVVYRARQHRRESLANLLWPDQAPELSRKYLRQALWRLHDIFAHRGGLPDPGTIVTAGHEWVRFTTSNSTWVDLAELESAMD